VAQIDVSYRCLIAPVFILTTYRPHTILTFVFMEQLRRLTTVGIPWLKADSVEEVKEAVLR
jgi:hypothetical protein